MKCEDVESSSEWGSLAETREMVAQRIYIFVFPL